MKALLICPGQRPAVPTLSLGAPLALLPVLGQPLLGVWIEWLAARGARELRIVAPDRAEAVQRAVGDGGRWGVRLEILPAGSEPTLAEAVAGYRCASESEVIVIDRLPPPATGPAFTSYAAWYAAVAAWMPHALTPARLGVHEARPGVWIGRRAQVAATARLVAPCWIGDLAYVGPGATVGPGAVLEDRSVVERGARVERSLVYPDTFVGRMTAITQSIASGPLLTNWRSGSTLRVPDPFLLCSLVRPARARRAEAPVRTAAPAALLRAAASVTSLLGAWWGRLGESSPSLKPPA